MPDSGVRSPASPEDADIGRSADGDRSRRGVTETDGDRAIDDQYGIFLEFLDKSTPAEAIKKFKLISADADLVARIVDRHERETIKLRQMDDPPAVYRNNRVTWYAGPRPGD